MLKTRLLFWVLFCGVAPVLANGQTNLTPADRKHGELVVRQIFVDRPDLGAVVAMDDPFVDWLEEQFAGGALGDRLYWDNSVPAQGSADYLSPNEHCRAFIRVSDDAAVASIDRCVLFVFILCAASEWETRDRLLADARSRAINRDEFVSGYVRMDLEAKVGTKKALKRLGFAERASDKTPITSMFLSHEEEYDAIKAKWQADDRDPRNPFVIFGRSYDALMAANPLSPGV